VRRGDLVTMVGQGDFGKPRPALVVQSDLYATHPTVTVLALTSDLKKAPMLRVTVEPTEQNGLNARSQVMIDKAFTYRREKFGPVFGRFDDAIMLEISRFMAVFLGIAS
jgi:mRNA interferase MazF